MFGSKNKIDKHILSSKADSYIRKCIDNMEDKSDYLKLCGAILAFEEIGIIKSIDRTVYLSLTTVRYKNNCKGETEHRSLAIKQIEDSINRLSGDVMEYFALQCVIGSFRKTGLISEAEEAQYLQKAREINREKMK